MMQVERFVAALDKYVDTAIKDVVEPGPVTGMNRTAAKQTMINELRLLLASGQEDTRTAAQRAAAWRK